MFLHAEKYSHLWFLIHEQNTSSIFSTSFLSTLLPKESPFRANVAIVIVGFSKSSLGSNVGNFVVKAPLPAVAQVHDQFKNRLINVIVSTFAVEILNCFLRKGMTEVNFSWSVVCCCYEKDPKVLVFDCWDPF